MPDTGFRITSARIEESHDGAKINQYKLPSIIVLTERWFSSTRRDQILFMRTDWWHGMVGIHRCSNLTVEEAVSSGFVYIKHVVNGNKSE